MGQILHGGATTTHAVRAAIQRSKASISVLSARHGVNPKTVAKWRKRDFVSDAPMGPKVEWLRLDLTGGVWRSLKHDAGHLVGLTDGFHAPPVIDGWMTFSNTDRPHSALGGATPNEAYGPTKQEQMAA